MMTPVRALALATLFVTIPPTAGVEAQSMPPLNGLKAFQAIGSIDPASIAVNITCPDGAPGTRLNGSLRGDDIGSGRYTVCLDVQIGPHQPWSPGTLTFTQDGGAGVLTMNLSAMRMSNFQASATYLGTFEVDPTSLGGRFAGQLAGGSGLLELSQPSRSLVLNGVLKTQ